MAESALASPVLEKYKGKVQLIFTSPPYPLRTKKRYGNETGQAYVDWLASLAPIFAGYLKPKGSIVIELGNAWEPGKPLMSVLGTTFRCVKPAPRATLGSRSTGIRSMKLKRNTQQKIVSASGAIRRLAP